MRLPVVIQAHLAGTELTDLKELAQMADRLWLCHGPQTVAAVAVEEHQSNGGGEWWLLYRQETAPAEAGRTIGPQQGPAGPSGGRKQVRQGQWWQVPLP